MNVATLGKAVDSAASSPGVTGLLRFGGVILGAWVVVGTVGATSWVDNRVQTAIKPVAEDVQVVKATTATIAIKVDEAARKDAADDEIATKTRERVALLEQLAINGKADRMRFQDQMAADTKELRAGQTEALRQLAALAATLEELRRQARYEPPPGKP